MNIWKRVGNYLLKLGPAFFIIGYVVGTGSVTSMVVSGAHYGMSMSWALFLSCLFTYFLLIAISKLTIVTGDTILYNFKQHFGKPVTIFIMLSLLTTIVSSIIGIMGIVSQVFTLWLSELTGGSIQISQLFIALLFTTLLIVLFWIDKYQTFVKVMSFLVAIMALSFVFTSFLVIQSPDLLWESINVANLPDQNPALVIAGMVGTTMASVVLVSRSHLVSEQGWSIKDLRSENKDAAVSMGLTFFISLAIMISATGTLYAQGLEVNNAIDMVKALEPWAGGFAMSLFAIGILGAGISSIFPNLLLFPWLIADYNHTEQILSRPLYRIIAIIIALTGLFVPLFGGEPVWILIASQALSPLVMPLLTLFLIILLNKSDIMKNYKIGIGMNIVLGAAFIFNCYMTVVAFQGFVDIF